jgi:hypothetical protein
VIVCNVIESTGRVTNRRRQLGQNHYNVKYANLLTGYQTIMDIYRPGNGYLVASMLKVPRHLGVGYANGVMILLVGLKTALNY